MVDPDICSNDLGCASQGNYINALSEILNVIFSQLKKLLFKATCSLMILITNTVPNKDFFYYNYCQYFKR